MKLSDEGIKKILKHNGDVLYYENGHNHSKESVIRQLKEERDRYRKALKEIAVYDVYDCGLSEDINYHDDAKTMYEIAKQALEKDDA